MNGKGTSQEKQQGPSQISGAWRPRAWVTFDGVVQVCSCSDGHRDHLLCLQHAPSSQFAPISLFPFILMQSYGVSSSIPAHKWRGGTRFMVAVSHTGSIEDMPVRYCGGGKLSQNILFHIEKWYRPQNYSSWDSWRSRIFAFFLPNPLTHLIPS